MRDVKRISNNPIGSLFVVRINWTHIRFRVPLFVTIFIVIHRREIYEWVKSIKSIKSLLSQLEFSTWAYFATNSSLFPGTIIHNFSLSLSLFDICNNNPPASQKRSWERVRIFYIVTYLWYGMLYWNLIYHLKRAQL